ncbi:hypothetical protein F5Y14DRAFT_439868 [Nemania sp. NC0429]|nr:hypothetical protein F5Y14DRAFT_439868 [Nemania sp. NC0429]
MMFLGTTRKAAEIRPEQQWDAISLRDFKASSAWPYLAYVYLYFSIILSLAVYGVDIFTAINLLVFNQWSSSIKPTQLLNFDQTKWIFVGTIIASFVNLAFEHFRARRVMKRSSVAECYLDNLAVRLESLRFGKGQGWRRFLVFAELTKSKKGAVYIALFSYFSLQSWIRVLLCSAPRQVINALTLYGIYTLNLTPTDASSFESTIGGFFSNIGALAEENTRQAVILSGMLFTLVVWVFSFLFLLLGILFYVFYLWHIIPRQYGGLHGYCEHKVNKRLKAIVKDKINTALAKQETKWTRAPDNNPTTLAGDKPRFERQATLPSLMDLEKGNQLPQMPMLTRNDTMTTLPAYTSRPGTPGSIELGPVDQKRSLPLRKATNGSFASAASYSSRAPLVASAAEMSFDRPGVSAPTLPNLDIDRYQGLPQTRTTGSNGGFNRQPPTNSLRSPDTLPPMPDLVRSPAPVLDSYSGMPASNVPPYSDSRSITTPSMYSSHGPYSNAGPSGYHNAGRNSPGYPPARIASQWHPGEKAVQRMLGVPSQDNPTVHGLRQAHAYRVMVSPLVAFGALDERGRPWATVWGGEAGFCRPIAENVLGVNGTTDARFDPVTQALFAVHGAGAGKSNDADEEEEKEEEESETAHGEKRIIDDELVRPAERKVMAGLSIDLETRDRLKLAGRFIAGAATATTPGVVNVQMAFAVEEALGNCPKYLNKKRIVPNVPTPELLWSRDDSSSAADEPGLPLPREAVELIAKADLFFIASKHGDGSMDVNHRGGPPGFLRVFRNLGSDADGADGDGDAGIVLVYPEYSGNRLYQTLGNLDEDPVAGLVVPDFETGDVLYLTGTTTTLVAERAAAYMPRAKLAVRIDVASARFVRNGLPFRGTVIDYSPYNPPVRRLAAEQGGDNEVDADAGGVGVATATLLERQNITPTIARYVFGIAPTTTSGGGGGGLLRAWLPGQHVTLDFSAELDHGYSHMRDDDPQSLNDDFVRTFTVSAPLDPGCLVDVDADGESRSGSSVFLRGDARPQLEIIARRHGPATALLAKWNTRVPLEIPVVGFGGAEDFRMPVPARRGPLTVLWSLRIEDLPLAVYVFEKIDGLGPVTRLFVTGSRDGVRNDESDLVTAVKNLGARVEERRMGRDDVLGAGGEKGRRKFFCCTGPALMRVLLQWMEGEEVAFESFEY